MKKVTKKDLNERLLMVETLLGLHRALPEQISNDQANNAIFRMQCALSSGKELAERKSQLKQLDQSVFNGLDEKWRFAAVDSNGDAVKYTLRVEPHTKVGEFVLGDDSVRNNLVKNFSHQLIGTDYDTSDWQNSLIERKELTGSDLCRAMLERGDSRVVCLVSDVSDEDAREKREITSLIEGFSLHSGFYTERSEDWVYAVPVNVATNEPLTQSDVGL